LYDPADKLTEHRCERCEDGIAVDEPVTRCVRCQRLYHEGCVEAFDGCVGLVCDAESLISAPDLGRLPAAVAAAEAGPQPDGDMETPPGVRVERRAGRLVVRRSWSRREALGLLLFAAAWLGGVVASFVQASEPVLTGGFRDVFSVPLYALAFGIGLVLLYRGLAGLFNRSELVVDHRWLRHAHRPLPWVGSSRIPVEAVASLVVAEHVRHRKGRRQVTWALQARLQAGDTRLVTDRGSDLDQKLFLKLQVDRFLGLGDEGGGLNPAPGGQLGDDAASGAPGH